MTHYQTLELPETASATDIRQAYRRLVLITHPDRTPDPAAHARYLTVNAAYEVLSDPSRRAAYDSSLAQPSPSSTYSQPAQPSRPQPAQPSQPQPAPPTRRNPVYRDSATDSYPAFYLKYAPAARVVCKVILFFGLLLGIDRAWVLDFPHEVVQKSYLSQSRHYTYCAVETPNSSFRGQCLDIGEVLAVRRTAIFRQVVAVCVPGTTPESAPDCYDDTSPQYTTGVALLPITMIITALVGFWPGPARRRQVDCAMTAAVFATITMWLLINS